MNKMVNSKFTVRVLALMGCGYLCCLFLKYYANLNTCRLESINYMSKQFYLNKTRENKLHQQTNQSEFNRRNKIHNNNFLDNITLVTAYFLLPPFQKGKIDAIRKPQEYLEWIKAFSWIVNPLIIYLDNVEIYYILEKIFKHSENNFVKLILVKRNQLWIFKQQHKIDEIFRQPNYPVHHPNTVVPAYNCVTHAKFELIKWSIEQNYYSTNYFMWIDIGYFRMQVDSPFGLSLPPDFDEQKVVLSQVEEFRNTLNLKTIIHYNLNWVAGGAILGRLDVLHKFCLKYLQFINTSLKLRMIGAEQQMIYAMYSGNLNKQEEDIQICNKGWFCLGHLAVATWFQNNGIKSKINK